MHRPNTLTRVSSITSALVTAAFFGCDPTPSIRIDPSAELDAIHRVTVSGKTSASSLVEIYQCVAGQDATCSSVAIGVADDTGSFTLSVDVRQTYEGGVCDAPGKCELALYASGSRQASAPIRFKPVGALALGTIAPLAAVTAGERLPIVGSNWASHTAVRLAVVPAVYTYTSDYRLADASGSFSHALSVRGFLVKDLPPVFYPFGLGNFKDLRDCVATPGSCVLVAHDFRASSPAIRIPLTVQQGAVTGTASIEQSMPLPYNSSTATLVFIEGSGWAANRVLEVYQCLPSLHGCIARPPITTDAAGAFRVQSSVFYNAMHANPESGYRITCDQPDSCVVVIADERAGLDAAAKLPMYFAAAPAG